MSHGHHSPSAGPPRSPTTGRPTTFPSPATSSSSSTAPGAGGGGSNGPGAGPASPASDNGDAPAGVAASSGAVSRPACRRPGCANPISDYSMNGFCSNNCVLSQSREVYNSWSSNGAGPQQAAAAAAVAGGPSSRD